MKYIKKLKSSTKFDTPEVEVVEESQLLPREAIQMKNMEMGTQTEFDFEPFKAQISTQEKSYQHTPSASSAAKLYQQMG